MENSDDVIEDHCDRGIGVFPGENDTWDNISDDRLSYQTGRFVEPVGKMIFRKKGVGWIGTERVVPRFELRMLIALLAFRTILISLGRGGETYR